MSRLVSLRASVAVVLVALAATAVPTVVASVGWNECNASFIGSFRPDQPKNAVQVCRDGVIAISYDVDMIDPAFSAYFVTTTEVNEELPGRKSFYEDPDLKTLNVTQAPVHTHAFNESWNKGHLCPNHILSYTKKSKKATFTMANVAPQNGYFNQQPWNRLEAATLDWIKANNALHIVTGVAYMNRSLAARTWDNIAVPDYYWKAVCDVVGGQSAAFVGNNVVHGEVGEIQSVSAVEQVYGGKIFPAAECNTATLNATHWWHPSTHRPLGL